jgi:hypothetical protein
MVAPALASVYEKGSGTARELRAGHDALRQGTQRLVERLLDRGDGGLGDPEGVAIVGMRCEQLFEERLAHELVEVGAQPFGLDDLEAVLALRVLGQERGDVSAWVAGGVLGPVLIPCGVHPRVRGGANLGRFLAPHVRGLPAAWPKRTTSSANR